MTDADNEAWWEDRRDEARREAFDGRTWLKLYRCPDRMCGAEDCAHCRGEAYAAETLRLLAEEDAEKVVAREGEAE